MNLYEQLRSIAERLLEKSRANEVNWVKESTSVSIELASGPKGSSLERVSVRFPQSAFHLIYGKPATDSDFIKAVITRDDGREAGELQASEDDTEDWRLLSALWMEAQRCLVRWDEVLVDVERNLSKPGKIGLMPQTK